MKTVSLALLPRVVAFAGRSPAAESASEAHAITKQQAIAAVRRVLNEHQVDCGHRLVRITARRTGLALAGWMRSSAARTEERRGGSSGAPLRPPTPSRGRSRPAVHRRFHRH